MKHNIAKREIQLKQLNQRLEKYKGQFQSKLKEIAEREAQKRAEIEEREEMCRQKEIEYQQLQ